ncbi:UDP-N-acetylglucosamine 1-carboxyvinyltransferase [Mesobacillus boroniphilus JCM 21738]|uniref:UDP-N-acetylglucosamine 1-carboxyvinyltransferase n=1 Tax=Mesobacillus boroniphilus JCM 21738 TaxID=1294265 RepID=W4RR20_9BACI|nr:UDP-N-acetylglucosamine 1-carboxyvinyltransferase [Mesobacillus boroniphilus JCM 21738]
MAKLKEMGAIIEASDEQIFVAPTERYKAIDIKTLVYPGFPTDLQQPFTALLTRAEAQVS